MFRMLDPHCIFCDYSANNPPGQLNGPNVFLSDVNVLGFMDIGPLEISAAHLLIIPRKHFEHLHDMSEHDEYAGALTISLSKVTNVLKDIVDTDEYNIVQNNGVAASQVVFHVHYHIVMRPKNDPESTYVKDLLVNGPGDEPWNEYQIGTYSRHVLCRGTRHRLRSKFMAFLVSELRSKLDDKR